MKTLNLTEITDRAFTAIEWGTPREKTQLYTLGKILACPEIGITDYLNYEDACKGHPFAENKTHMNHWQIRASELASSLVCMMIYQNRERIHIRKFPFMLGFYQFLLKKHLYLNIDYAYDKEKINKFCKQLEKESDITVSLPYLVHILDEKHPISKESWIMTYGDVMFHPYVRENIDGFLRCGEYEKRDILIQMTEGMEKHLSALRSSMH